MEKPLTDTEIYDLLTAALGLMAGRYGDTMHGDRTLRAAEHALQVFRFGVLLKIEGISAESLIPKKG